MERSLYIRDMDEISLDKRNKAAFRRDFLPAVVGYWLALLAVTFLVGDRIDSYGEWVLVALPLIPALWGVRAFTRHLDRVDEYRRLLQLEAMAVGFGVSMVVALTLGFVGLGGVATRSGGWLVVVAGMISFKLVSLAQERRN